MASTLTSPAFSPSGFALKQRLHALLSQPSAVTMMLAVSIWFSLLCNSSFWSALWPQIAGDAADKLAVVLLAGAAVTGLQWALLSLFAWRGLLKPVATAVVVIAAVAASMMQQYGVVIDTGMLVNVWQTDAMEVKGLISFKLVLQVLALSVLPMVWIWRAQVRYLRWSKQALHNVLTVAMATVLAVLCLLPLYKEAAAIMRNDKSLRYRITPSNAVYGAIASLRPAKAAGPLVPQGLDAHVALATPAATTKPRLLVLVVGETARADHFSTNGYARNTTPELLAADVINFPHVTSCGTSTAVSLPCMFSVLGKDGHTASKQHNENVLDVVQRAGYRVLWLDNQAGCKGVCDRVVSETTSAALTPALCADQECLDEAMLSGLDARVARLLSSGASQPGKSPGVVVVMHQMGSHGPEYYRRSPAAMKGFTPECRTANFGDCTQEAIINAYDNSIRYTSHFLGLTMQWLQAQSAQYDTAMLYLSDHGESLGEAGLYLHGMPYALAPSAQTHVPMVAWLSPAWLARQPLNTHCLREQAQLPRSHDNLSPTLLGLLSIQTKVYKQDLDVFSSCVSQAQAQTHTQPPATSKDLA
ncbi:phosphoethanolamine transferase [Lampropedia aestuarii]|nr:phosphoethanolamine--lipid A transferase [Lampropedia aestuarii]